MVHQVLWSQLLDFYFVGGMPDHDDWCIGAIIDSSPESTDGDCDCTQTLASASDYCAIDGQKYVFANTAQETTQINTSGYYSTLYSVRLQREFRRNLLGNVQFSYSDNEYEFIGSGTGSLTDTEVIRASVGLSYLFNRHVYISGGYIYEDQSRQYLHV